RAEGSGSEIGRSTRTGACYSFRRSTRGPFTLRRRRAEAWRDCGGARHPRGHRVVSTPSCAEEASGRPEGTIMSEEHDRLESLVTRYVEGAVTIAERLEIESHLASCAGCRASLESEARTKKTMSVETKMFTAGYDARGLEANLSHELRSGERQTRWLIALSVLSGLLTLWALAWPPTP